jgi:hypothetical protein
MKKVFLAVFILAIFFNSAVVAQDYDEDDLPYLTDEDIAALENTEWDIDALEPLDMSEQETVSFSDAPIEVRTSEMSRLNASQPIYHLLILDRLYSPLNSDISDTDGISILYKYRHGRNGYLVALYKSTAGGPVFPQLPDKSRVMADLVSVHVNTIREYIRSSAFKKFVTNRRVLTGMDAVLRNEKPGSFQKIDSEANTNEMARINASQPV